MIFGVSLYLPIIFTNVPGRGDKSTPLNCSSKKDVDLPERNGRKQSGGWNRLLEQIAFPLFSTCIGTSSELSVIWKFKLSPLETYHAPPLRRINSRTAFVAFSNGGAAAIIITQNTTASQAKC